LKQTNY